MRRHAWTLGLALALGCGKDSPTNPDAGPKPDENPNQNSPFTQLVVDADPSEFDPISSIAMAIGPENRIGMAYFVRLNTVTENAPDYELRYREFNGGSLRPAEAVAKVQRVYGVSVAFGPNGQPAVSYLGGRRDGGPDDSTFWYQSDMAVSYRNANGTWTERIAVTMSNQAVAGNIVSDGGWLVGLNSSMVFAGNQALVVYRDGHRGQSPQQDWAGSDLELASGGPTAWQHRVLAPGGNDKQGWGAHASIIMAGNQPAVVHDTAELGAQATGVDVVFQRRNADGATWTPPVRVQSVPNTQLGASMAYDATVGFGIAVLNRNNNALTFIECDESSGTKCAAVGDWTTPDPVFNSGTGGWYPSLAFDPRTHEPSIAYYNCALESGRNETSCNTGDDELVVSTRIGGIWRETLVDAGGGWSPKLAYLSDGKRVVLYRAPVVATDKGTLKLAVEK
ncbi:hypothetical protein HPC49_22645 [Pyxidicoccus fallax]|uniref:Lipoprotein n=1 Tax=Pyxidicoccus fallax TaxID=394095 RepID=A0A848LS44_9BACT|nr:hypothetical protein [Pyxidicoccus fallax]NMO20254.1 hypothetical protein [Pyxidicoccus fallax]NPC81012.1 hypothetical protein [Pyxidicoccus fallax]